MSTQNEIDQKLFEYADPAVTNIFLFGDASFDRASNTQILNATIKYILSTERFEETLFFNFCAIYDNTEVA